VRDIGWVDPRGHSERNGLLCRLRCQDAAFTVVRVHSAIPVRSKRRAT